MLVKNPSHRKALNSNQIKLLQIVFKFRFVTVPLLAEYLGKDKSTVYEQLLTLTSQDYLTKNYDSSYRLPPRPATYCLATKGIKYLYTRTDFSQAALRNQYKNGAASEQLVEQSLKTFKLCNQLRRQYPNQFAMFTKSEMSKIDELVRPLPDLYLRRNVKKRNTPDDYLIDILQPGIPSWLLRKRIRLHYEHDDENEFQYPNVLLICTNDSTEKRAQRILNNVAQDFEFWTTVIERFDSGMTEVWLDDDECLISL